MDSIFIDQMSTNYNEDVLLEEMDKKYFVSCLDFYDFKVESILSDKIFTEQKESFNYVIRKIKEHFDIPILKSILYLEKDFIKLHDLLIILDDKNIYTLKQELCEKYNKKIEKNFNSLIWNFFSEEE